MSGDGAAGGSKSTTREYYEALLIAVIFVNFARIFLFQAFRIPTGSMAATLLVGDHILVNKFIYGPEGSPADTLGGISPIRRGDVVIFRYPADPATDFVKRVVALPGETVLIRDKVLSVNGSTREEPYVTHSDPNVIPYDPEAPDFYRTRDQFGPYVVPPGSYFVLGDNRDLSHDSRFWGAVRREFIKGKALLIYWSFDGAPPPQGSPPLERLRELVHVATHFISRTRWERTARIIDGT
jgi:signal peptidase I